MLDSMFYNNNKPITAKTYFGIAAIMARITITGLYYSLISYSKYRNKLPSCIFSKKILIETF